MRWLLPMLAGIAGGGCSQPAPPAQSNDATVEANRGMPASGSRLRPDGRSDFLRAALGDDWARPPPNDEDGEETERPCTRVAEPYRAEAIGRLLRDSAIRLTREEYRRLTGANERHEGVPYLLRGFASNDSVARLMVAGDAVTVESDSLGGLFRLRRHPCVAFLDRRPARVFTYATSDM